MLEQTTQFLCVFIIVLDIESCVWRFVMYIRAACVLWLLPHSKCREYYRHYKSSTRPSATRLDCNIRCCGRVHCPWVWTHSISKLLSSSSCVVLVRIDIWWWGGGIYTHSNWFSVRVPPQLVFPYSEKRERCGETPIRWLWGLSTRPWRTTTTTKSCSLVHILFFSEHSKWFCCLLGFEMRKRERDFFSLYTRTPAVVKITSSLCCPHPDITLV